MSRPAHHLPDHTLVLDIGKSNAKLLLISAAGEVLARRSQPNRSAPGPGYTALGVAALQSWLLDAIPTLPERERISHLSISTHGAAFCAIDADDLVLPPIDYEWDGYAKHRADFAAAIDPFEHTGSPLLPLGLNAGLQLHWLQQTRPDAWARIRHWLPYPQYWAWWFSGVAASEVSSLGCHTQLWSPAEQAPSRWARRSGIAALLAPLRRAWEVLGPVRPPLAAELGLPADCAVLCGLHDSNACLARYLGSQDDTTLANATLLSTGTWTVLMAPGAPIAGLDAQRDELVNVAIDGRAVPTARFMGGREFAVLCDGADPALATEPALREVIAQGWQALPAFADSGGPFQGRPGAILQHGQPVAGGIQAVPAALRPALAALYCAQVSALLLDRLGGRGPVILEGPLAGNAAYGAALAALLGEGRPLSRSVDELEGTARGAWLLTRWQHLAALPPLPSTLQPIARPDALLAQALRQHMCAWP